MTIGARLTVWFSAILVLAVLGMGLLSYNEFVLEPRALAASGKPAEAPLEEILEALAWCAVPALALGFGGGWWISRRAMAPVRSLTQAAERINEHHLGEQLPRSGNNDELDRLTGVFNDMTARLQHSFARIREFTLHASHELKTPLTVMHGELETALSDAQLPAKERERIESQLDEVQRLSRIVDGLTLLTKVGAGQVQLQAQPVAFDELVRETVLDAQSLAKDSHVQVNLTHIEPITISGDRHRLRQLLLNLADNAVKYNRPDGSVQVALFRNNGSAEMTLSNTGPGISADELEKVFDPFFRGKHASSGSTEGCGLGLSIAKWIATAHQGDLQIASSPNGSTTVKLCLPASEEKK